MICVRRMKPALRPDLAERGAVDAGVRAADLHRVGEVEHLEAELGADAAVAEPDALGRHEVPVVAVRRAHESSVRGIVPSVKLAGVERPEPSSHTPVPQSSVHAEPAGGAMRSLRLPSVAVGRAVRPLHAREDVGRVGVGAVGQREAALERDDRRDGPVAEQDVADPARSATSCLRRTAARRSARTPACAARRAGRCRTRRPRRSRPG